MKNLFRSLLAAAVLFGAAACTTEDISTSVVGNGDPIEVTFTADLGAANTRAYGEGKMANELIVKIYDAHNDALLSDLCPKANEITYNNGKFTFNVVMVKGMEYKILLWAQNSACAEVYTVKDDKTLEIDYSKLAKKENNDENLDAFYYYTPVNDTFDPTVDQPSFTLRRPFAQLNAYTNDMAAVRNNGIVKNFKSSVTVSAYTSFNFVDGKVLGNPTNVTFDATAIPSETDGYLSMNYLLASNDGSLVNATYVFTGDRNDDSTVTFTGTEYNDVPLKSNHRTNILGALLTKPMAVEVKVEAGFDEPAEKVVVVATASELQAALDNAAPNTTIQLEAGVDYGTLLIRPVAGAVNTTTDCDYLVYRNEMLRKVENLTILGAEGAKVDAIKVVAGHIEGSTGYVVDIKNLVINGVEFNDTYTNAPHSYAAPIFFDLTYTNVDGLTVKNCELIGDNDKMNFVYVYGSGNPSNSTFATAAKNITLTGNTVDGIARLCELRQTENVTITNNTIKNTVLHGILLPVDGGTYSGNVTITGNTAEGINERFVRMAGAGEAVVVIKNNTISNYLGEDEDYIKVTDGTNVTIENNICTTKVAEGVGMDAATGNYYISSAEGLKWVADEVNKVGAQAPNVFDNVTVFLNNDIDLQNAEWTPIGDYAFSRTAFRGTFDGQGHTISNFKITQLNSRPDKVAEASYGLFGNMAGTIQNLNIDNATVTPAANGAYVGVLVGRLKAGAIINNCHITNSVATTQYWQVGGIAGQADHAANILNSSIKESTITGKAAVGGIIGLVMNPDEYTIENCEVKNCDIIQNGSFGGGYDNMFGVAVGSLNKSGVILNINDISAEGNTVKGAASNTLVGYVADGANLYLNGVVSVATSAQLETAIANDATITLAPGTYVIPTKAQGKTLTFVGTGDPTQTVIATNTSGSYEGCNYNLSGSTVVFENVSITTDNLTYTGYASCNATFNNCIINNSLTLYGDMVFNNCTFNVSGDQYNIWTWAAPTATFNNCTFNSDGKALLLYGGGNTVLTVNNCVFNDSGVLPDLKAAIEIGSDYGTSVFELIVNNTTVNGYEISDKGINTGTTLWANKNSMGQDKLNVVVDGVDVY